MTSSPELSELRRLAKGRIVLELGSSYGDSTMALAETARMVHSVDWHYGDKHHGEMDTLPLFLQRCRPAANIVIHIGRFEDILPIFALGAFGFIFVDGYHAYDAVRRDIHLARPLLSHTGVMAFHDYTIPEFGVRKAVTEAFGNDLYLVDSLAVIRW